MATKSLAVQRRNLFFQHMIALGFDVPANEERYKIKFDVDMFCIPNKKAFEIVSHFLFEKLNEVSSKKYVLPWPLLNVQAHREFQKTCFNYLSTLAQESTVKFPLITSSVLSSYGEAFYKLYLAFSTHIVWATNEKLNDIVFYRPRTDAKYYEKSIEVLKNAVTASFKKFMAVSELTKHFVEDFVQGSNTLTAFINNLKRTNSTNQSFLNSRAELAKDIFMLNDCSSLDDIVEKFSEYQSKVGEYNSHLEQFFMNDEKFWSSISSELQETSSKPVLKGCEFNDISHILEKYSKELEINQGIGDKNTFILKYLKLFGLVLQIYLSSISQGSFQKTSKCDLSKEISFMENFLKKMTSLSPILEENNRVAHSSINELSENLDGPVENLFKIKIDFPCAVSFSDVSENLKLASTEATSKEMKETASDKLGELDLENFTSSAEFKEMDDSALTNEIRFEPGISDVIVSSASNEETALVSQMDIQNVHDTTLEDVDLTAVEDQDSKNSSLGCFSHSFLDEESLNSQFLPDISFLE